MHSPVRRLTAIDPKGVLPSIVTIWIPRIEIGIALKQPSLDLHAVAESLGLILEAVLSGDAELACRLSREHQEYFERRA